MKIGITLSEGGPVHPVIISATAFRDILNTGEIHGQPIAAVFYNNTIYDFILEELGIWPIRRWG